MCSWGHCRSPGKVTRKVAISSFYRPLYRGTVRRLCHTRRRQFFDDFFVQPLNKMFIHCGLVVRHKPYSTLLLVMVCCLTAPSHYPNQFWFIIPRVLLHSPRKGSSTGNAHEINHYNKLDTFKFSSISHWPLLLTWFNFNPSTDK